MKDQYKTKQSLIQELASLREKVTELEKSEAARKKLENALREKEERYRLIIENTADTIAVFDLNLNLTTYVSPFIRKLRGYTVQQ